LNVLSLTFLFFKPLGESNPEEPAEALKGEMLLFLPEAVVFLEALEIGDPDLYLVGLE
jgi:hypothetical protein